MWVRIQHINFGGIQFSHTYINVVFHLKILFFTSAFNRNENISVGPLKWHKPQALPVLCLVKSAGACRWQSHSLGVIWILTC